MSVLASRSTQRMGLVVLALAACLAGAAEAQPTKPLSVPPPGRPATAVIPMLRDVGVDQKLDAQVPLDIPLVDHQGTDVRLGDYFGQRPVLLVLSYYECPVLCTQVLNGVVSSMVPLTFSAGEQFDVVAVSFDPGETPGMARAKREDFLRRYGRQGAEAGVHFLTGRPDSIARLTAAVGFKYAYDEAIDQYGHPAVITLLTPEGRVSRYLFGIEFAPRDLRFGLIDAAQNRIGTVVDQALLFCYNYDPETGTYGLAIMTSVRLAGVLTLLGLGAFIIVMLRRERRGARAVGSTATGVR
jgi:protein SCO1/2